MSKFNYRKATPFSIKLIGIAIIIFSSLLATDFVAVNSQERTILTGLIIFLVIIVLIYLALLFWGQRYIAKIASQITYRSNKESKLPNQETQFKELVENAAPAGYKLEMSLEKKISFCYPEGWLIIRPSDPLLYMQVREAKLGKGLGILRNFNVSVQNIEGVNTDFLFDMIIKGVLDALKEGRLELKEPFKTKETWGMRYKINYKSSQQTDLCCYQTAVTNSNKRKMVLLTFTTTQDDFPKTRELFDDITELVKIFD